MSDQTPTAKVEIVSTPVPTEPTLEEVFTEMEELVDEGESPVAALQKSRLDLDKALEEDPNEVAPRMLQLIQRYYLNDSETEAAVRAALMEILMDDETSDKDRVAAGKELRDWVRRTQEKGIEAGGLLAQFFKMG